MWDLNSLTGDGTCTLCIGRWSLNPWTAREVPRWFDFTHLFGSLPSTWVGPLAPGGKSLWERGKTPPTNTLCHYQTSVLSSLLLWFSSTILLANPNRDASPLSPGLAVQATLRPQRPALKRTTKCLHLPPSVTPIPQETCPGFPMPFLCLKTILEISTHHPFHLSFPGGASGKDPIYKCRRHKRCKFNPWIRMILWRRKWQPTPVFLPGESHGQRSLAGRSS